VSRVALTLLVTLSLVPGLRAGDKPRASALSVQHLIDNKDKYAGQEVTVFGCYLWLFEWSELIPCEELSRGPNHAVCIETSETARHKLKEGKFGSYRPVTVRAKFETGRRFCHENLFTNHLEVVDVIRSGKEKKMPKRE
jgi:hypothetical protein